MLKEEKEFTDYTVKSINHEPAVEYKTNRSKILFDLRASDVPRGMDPEDFATDFQ